MSLLGDLVGKAKSWLGAAAPKPELSTQAIRQNRFDAMIYDEALGEVPGLREMIHDLNVEYDYTQDLVGDTFAAFFQASPSLRPRGEMKEGWLANHAVAQNIAQAPDTPSLRSYSQHNKYGAAMATLGVAEKVRGYLAENKELAQAAAEAEKARQEAAEQQQQVAEAMPQGEASAQGLDQAMKDLQAAAAALSAAQDAADDAMGEFDGNGPLTEAQAQAQAQAQAAAQAQAQAQAAADAAQGAADLTAQMLADLLAQAEAARAAADAAGEQVQQAAQRAERATRVPVAAAVKQAADDLEAEEQMFKAWGFSDGELERMSFAERQQMGRRLSGSKYKDFVKHLGRWRSMQKAQFAHNVEHSREEFYDVELTGNLFDVLPTEYAHLGTEPGRVDFLSRLSERQLLGKKFRGTERAGQGAIVACCDTSGSMIDKDKHGIPRDVFGKGFLLALLDQARAEKRDFVGIIFANASKQKVFHFPGGQASIEQVLEMTEMFFGGGTDFQNPLDLAMGVLEKQFNSDGKAKADIVFITDDDCAVSPEWLATYQQRKAKLGFRTFGVAVGMARAGGTLASLSDDVRAVQEFIDPSVVGDIIRTV